MLTPVNRLLAADIPARGRFLVATHDLAGSFFAETVILLLQHDDQGTMGLIINQPSDIGLSTMLPEETDPVEFDGKLYIGGPVSTYGIMMLIRSELEPAESEHIFGNVYASGSRDVLMATLGDADALSRVRLYAGHAGWFPGQLDGEIARGSWQIVPADERTIFSPLPGEIWKKLAPPPGRIVVHAAWRQR
jgi:putative transcriptional regulator